MAKKWFKSLCLGMIVFATAVLIGYLSYVIAYHHQTNKLRETAMPRDIAVAADSNELPAADETFPMQVDYYTARLENRDIAIYMAAEGQEIFLYSLGVYTDNLPATDLLRLREGVVLKTRQELASFEEDYTS